MNSTKLKYLFITALALFFLRGQSQGIHTSDRILFHQGKSLIDYQLGNNRLVFNEIESLLDSISANPREYSLQSISLIGTASPEGPVMLNNNLSKARFNRVLDHIRSSNQVDVRSVATEFTGRDWNGLYSQVLNDPNVPARDESLEIIRAIIDSVNAGNPQPVKLLNRLLALDNGSSYAYMYRHLYPSLRSAIINVDYIKRYQPLTGSVSAEYFPAPAIDELSPLATPVIANNGTHRPLYLALKTNLLFDAAALPNIGAEIYVGRNFTVGGNWMYGWWDNDSKHRYWRAYGGDLFARYWFGNRANDKPLTGHHVGIFAGVVTYDFELGKQGIMGGLPGRSLWDRCNTVAGIEYGYSLPVAKRLNIDFSLAIGYFGGKYIKYTPVDGYYQWNSTHRLNWFGPVKAEISLVWLIGHGNTNNKKGGIK